MAISTVKFSELPFQTPVVPLCSRFRFRLHSSVRIADQNPNPSSNPNPRVIPHRSKPPSAPWLQHWDPAPSPSPPPPKENPRPPSSIERIVHRLRDLGLDVEGAEQQMVDSDRLMPLNGDERLGDLLQRSWSRPDLPSGLNPTVAPLPWERGAERPVVDERETGKKRTVKAPTLAELTIEDGELKRLRRMGMTLRERINIPKAGVTQVFLEKIHDFWKRSEIVRLRFHEDLAHDMKTAHEIVEVRDSW